MIGENWTDWVWEITGWSSRVEENYRSFRRNLWNIPPNLRKEKRRMSICNRLDLQTLGSQPDMPKNLPDHLLRRCQILLFSPYFLGILSPNMNFIAYSYQIDLNRLLIRGLWPDLDTHLATNNHLGLYIYIKKNPAIFTSPMVGVVNMLPVR